VALFIAALSVPVFAQTAIIQELSGTVEVKQASGGWVRAAVGMRLEPDMTVSTGFRSTALIRMGTSTVVLRPLTRIGVEELAASPGKEQAVLSLRTGRIRASVNPPVEGGTADFHVRSPTATASVRGTKFDMDLSTVKMYSGALAFAGSDGVPAIVSAGRSGYAGTGGQVSDNLNPDMPLGIQSGNGRIGISAPPPEGSVTGRIGWYGQTP
jgi:hypothetical protein